MTLPHKPILIVIARPNGSGKTTITSKLLRHEWLEDALYINPDNVARDLFGDWNSTKAVVDRLYVYDNSRDGEEAQLLFRKSSGELVKQYVDELPEWAKLIY